MAKLTRESKLRERRVDKAARKSARKLAPEDRPAPDAEAAHAASSDEIGSASG